MRIPLSIVFFIILIIAFDLYSFRAIYILIKNKSKNIRTLISVIYWSISILFIFFFVLISTDLPKEKNIHSYPDVFLFFALMMMVYLPKLIIIIFQLIRDLSVFTQKLVFSRNSQKAFSKDRREFITKTGIILASIPFLGTFYGIIKGRFNYQLNKISLQFNNLPISFNGIRIVQISDFHISCFIGNEVEVEKIVELINNEKPDIIVFTGDMINNYSNEMDSFLSTLKNLHAPLGKFAITGNHDYGDYSKWESKKAKEINFNNLIKNYASIGFKVLRNERTIVQIGDESIELIGVENWGQPPFPKYGDLKKAMVNSDANNFRILLSHDPSHWREEVLNNTSIDLTLSGHTHGMQFGIDIPGFKWSPVQYKYPEWAGLYQNNQQLLYVNRGIGYIGVAARVGILPEITMLEITKS